MSMDELLKELQDEYIHELPDKIKEIQKAYKTNDYKKVTDCFHKIKGSGLTYSVPELSKIGETLETICLKYPNYVGWAIPKALYFMQQVYTYRLAGRVYSPEDNEDFKKLLGVIHPKAA